MKRRGLELLLCIALGCGGERPDSEPPQVSHARAAQPVPVAVLRSARDTLPGGRIAGMEVHVLLPAIVSAATARATLQHVIDSIAARDSIVAGIRVVGFRIGAYDSVTHEAEVTPAIIGVWAPTDTVGFTGRTGMTMFRTTFTLLQPLAEDTVFGGGL